MEQLYLDQCYENSQMTWLKLAKRKYFTSESENDSGAARPTQWGISDKIIILQLYSVVCKIFQQTNYEKFRSLSLWATFERTAVSKISPCKSEPKNSHGCTVRLSGNHNQQYQDQMT